MRILVSMGLPIFISLVSLMALADDTHPPQSPTPTTLTSVVQNDEGEDLLADSFNRTLYVLDSDQGHNTPTCEGTCAELWPPYILNIDEAGRLQAPLGRVLRKGSNQLQLTYNDRPVYTYSMDRSNGDDKGNGIDNVWHYVEVDQ